METEHHGRGRPRRAETEESIAEATLALLRERGPAAVTIASVSARSGVARTTVYRRYRDRTELLRAALGPVTDRGTPAPESSVREKLVWALARTQEVVTHGIGAGGVAAVLTGSDPEFSTALRESLQSGLAPLVAQLGDDVAAGRVGAHVDPETVITLVLGAHLAELVRSSEPHPDWIERTADLLAHALDVRG